MRISDARARQPVLVRQLDRRQGAARLLRPGLAQFLALGGVAIFQSLVYLGLRTTTAVNAVLLNSSIPMFVLLCSWAIERERASPAARHN